MILEAKDINLSLKCAVAGGAEPRAILLPTRPPFLLLGAWSSSFFEPHLQIRGFDSCAPRASRGLPRAGTAGARFVRAILFLRA